MLSEEYAAKLGGCEDKIDALHVVINALIAEHVQAVSDRRGTPREILRGRLMLRSVGCLCDALKKVAAGKDGL
jgi:hypothetical protein